MGLAGYHAAWLAGGDRYSWPALWAIGACGAAALLALVLVRSRIVAIGTCVRLFLVAGGFGAAVLGADLVLGRATVGTPTTTDVVGALAMLGGLLTFSAGIYLRTDVDRPSSVHPGPGPVAEERFVLGGAQALLRRYPGFVTATNRIVDVCRPLVATVDLHFVAYHVDGDCRFSLDVLEDPGIEGFFDQTTPEDRRRQYQRQARYLSRLVGGLNDSFREIDAGVLIRVVLDVERGALYYYWIDDRRFVIGVTLDQEMVDRADRTMVHVVDGIRASLGHRRIGDLER
jgi:hypothetical protein